MSTILVVDDEVHIREVVEQYLQGEGHAVLTAREGEEALRLAHTARPDLMILDLMLPKMDGLEVCRRLRQEGGDLPIIILTARSDDVDKIVGLELGADDYMTKPFNPRELMARVKAVLRRSERRTPPTVVRLGDVILDTEAREARVGARHLTLRLKEFDLLAHLMEHANAAQSREQLLEHVWGAAYYGDTRTVDVHIARLRDKLRGSQVDIETVWGIGYRLVFV